MQNPAEFIRNNVLAPSYNFYKQYIGKSARHRYCQSLANFMFEKSQDTAFVMLIFNALSIFSSHLAQIRGLKKSNRENKDYLISQERVELWLDLALTTIPPSIINHTLKKKLEGGEITTKLTRKNLTTVVAPAAGVQIKELCNTDHIPPYWQNMKQSAKSVLNNIKKTLKDKPKALWDFLNIKDIQTAETLSAPKMSDIAIKADLHPNDDFKKLYNGKAYDDIIGGINGATILATIGYTIVVSSIVMPIIKNLIANYSYKKQLEKMGETPESIKRKKKYNDLMMSYNETKDSNIFNTFIDFDNTSLKANNSLPKVENSIKAQPLKKNVFQDMNTFVSTGLRI